MQEPSCLGTLALVINMVWNGIDPSNNESGTYKDSITLRYPLDIIFHWHYKFDTHVWLFDTIVDVHH